MGLWLSFLHLKIELHFLYNHAFNSPFDLLSFEFDIQVILGLCLLQILATLLQVL